jgi:arylamine N-acetyltransferase
VFDSAGGLDEAVRAAYLRRLGVDAEPPSAQALRLLVQRHTERVPYETWWIAAGEGWTIDPVAAAERIALRSRGGYCYHLNGALGLLLTSLGYRVRAHVGGVQGARPDPEARGNHLVLTLTGLPSDDNPDGEWYVDAGLGDALRDPLPLVAGDYDQAPFRLGLASGIGSGTGSDTGSSTGSDGSGRAADVVWTLTHDPAGGFGSMTWTSGPAAAADFVAKHEWLSTSPDSGFVQVPMCEARDASGVDVVRGLVLSRVGAGAFTADPITSASAWFELLADRFSLTFAGSTPQWRRRLWEAVVARHEAWVGSQSPT